MFSFVSVNFVSTSQFAKEVLVQRVAFLTTACWHEDVAADELVNYFAVGGHTAERDVNVSFKLYSHLEGSDEKDTH